MVNRVKAGIPVYRDITLIPFTGLYTDFNGNNGLRQLVRSAVKKMASVYREIISVMLVGQLIMRISVLFMLQYNSVPLKKAVIPVYHGKKKTLYRYLLYWYLFCYLLCWETVRNFMHKFRQ